MTTENKPQANSERITFEPKHEDDPYCDKLNLKSFAEDLLGHVLIWFLKFEPDKSASKHHYSPEIPG